METERIKALEARSLRKGFGKLAVLDGVSFGVEPGELVCILGPSGCGKTTILRAIAGLLPIDGGTILVGGQDIASSREPLNSVSVVFQEPRLLPWRTARDNVRLSLELRKDRLENSDEVAIDDALSLVGLSEFAALYPHELSGGMKQRVSLARALVTEPRVLLMDEPLTGLDLRSREELQDEIIRIWNRTKVTLVLVTHDPAEAIHLADRIIVLSPRPARIRDIISVDLPRPRARVSAEARRLETVIRGLFSDSGLDERKQK